MSIFQKTRNGSLESDCPFEMLDRLEQLCMDLTLAPRVQVDQSMIEAARIHFGKVVARGCEIFWQWPELFDGTQNCFCLRTQKSFWQAIETFQDHDNLDVRLFSDYQGDWELFYRPMLDAVIFDYNANYHWCHGDLAQYFVGFALIDIGIHFSPYRIMGWPAQEWLDDQTQWELLWHKTSFIDGQTLYYLHKNKDMLVWSSGAFINKRITTKTGTLLEEMADIICEAPDLREATPPKRKLYMPSCFFPTQSLHLYNIVFDGDDIPF